MIAGGQSLHKKIVGKVSGQVKDAHIYVTQKGYHSGYPNVQLRSVSIFGKIYLFIHLFIYLVIYLFIDLLIRSWLIWLISIISYFGKWLVSKMDEVLTTK